MKSVETKFNEALAAIDKAGKRKVFNEKVQAGMTIETKLNLAEDILKDVGVLRAKESAPIRKHNGVADNLTEGNPLRLEEWRESVNNFSAGYIKETTDPCAKGDKVMFDGLLKLGKITEAEHAKLTGKKPAGYEQLTEMQRRQFDCYRQICLSEAECFALVKNTGSNFKEASRR